jgi:hypothetical protein
MEWCCWNGKIVCDGIRDERKKKVELKDVDACCEEKVGDFGDKQDGGIKLCLDCMRGRKRCDGRVDKRTSCIVLVGLWMIGEKTEGSKVVVINESIRMMRWSNIGGKVE